MNPPVPSAIRIRSYFLGSGGRLRECAATIRIPPAVAVEVGPGRALATLGAVLHRRRAVFESGCTAVAQQQVVAVAGQVGVRPAVVVVVGNRHGRALGAEGGRSGGEGFALDELADADVEQQTIGLEVTGKQQVRPSVAIEIRHPDPAGRSRRRRSR
ncbi:hypothetical protein HFP89_03425 [Wenzhouxiangella sp. XN79A]|uniref:hypothetical protein n=1 Tax=Wenzhouxiangella sp. XN79A TaxID=2724193 RepID=UPI00144AB59D|nr:hypothetical protein [Wenzhouxiangella sp. XN79A]NKI34215.1 hypothetical protein [Wenzhouxiangella sp. XN79A]